MYSRHPSEERYSIRAGIPNNYGGNAFRENVAPPVEETVSEPLPETQSVEAVALQKQTEDNTAAKMRLFGRGGGGIGFEELLILGIVILISQNETKDDLAYLLLLLLFIQ